MLRTNALAGSVHATHDESAPSGQLETIILILCRKLTVFVGEEDVLRSVVYVLRVQGKV